MKGYVFTYGVDGFGADVAPAYEIGVYLDFKKAFAKLVELNHKAITEGTFVLYEKGYGEDYYPSSDLELAKADKEEDWDLFIKLMEKHTIRDEKEINKEFINEEPFYGMYALEEIEIIK
jgi:hypothetical protein